MYKSVQSISDTLQTNNRIKPIHQQNQPTESLSFKSLFKNALENVSQLENESNKKTELLALGKDVSLHDVMISAQKTAITIDATLQIQQKVIDAYNEVMRMQI